MANLFWTIVPFVLTSAVATWRPQANELREAQPAKAKRRTGPCLG